MAAWQPRLAAGTLLLGLLILTGAFGPGVATAQDPPIPEPPTLEEAEKPEPMARPKPIEPTPADEQDARLLDSIDMLGNGAKRDATVVGTFSDDLYCDDGCGGCGRVGCSTCGAGAGYYFRSELLQWWTNGTRLPVLLTGSESGDGFGVLDDPDTTILWGGTRVNNRGRTAYRFTIGYWFDPCHNFGWEVDYFDLGLQPTSRGIDCFDGGPAVLARPYYDAVNEVQSSQLICHPDLSIGEFGVQSRHYFESTGARVRRTLLSYCKYPACGAGCGGDCGPGTLIEEGSTVRGQCDDALGCGPATGCTIAGCAPMTVRLDGTFGYRYYNMTDHLDIHEKAFVNRTGTQAQVGTAFIIDERFHASNTFHGGEIGLIARVDKGCWSLELMSKLAMGNSRQRLLIDGRTVVIVPDQDAQTYQGGLLALPTNIGVHTRDRFVLIPQFGLEMGYQVTRCVRLHVGYDLLYWGNIVGAGDHIDLAVNPSQVPPGQLVGPARPTFRWNDSHFWAQGIRLGAELRF